VGTSTTTRPRSSTATPPPSRQGAPFEIATFDNVGEPLAEFNSQLDAHCGAAGPQCLVIKPDRTPSDTPDDACIIDSFAYDPAPGGTPDENGKLKLQRGTTVTVACSARPSESS
jgi:hypothetical protein